MKQPDGEGVVVASSNLKVGQQVHLSSGPFDGLVGVIQDPPDAKGRIKVLMTLLSRQVKVVVPVSCVK